MTVSLYRMAFCILATRWHHSTSVYLPDLLLASEGKQWCLEIQRVWEQSWVPTPLQAPQNLRELAQSPWHNHHHHKQPALWTNCRSNLPHPQEDATENPQKSCSARLRLLE